MDHKIKQEFCAFVDCVQELTGLVSFNDQSINAGSHKLGMKTARPSIGYRPP